MSYRPRILAFAGSARKDSFNKKLVRIAAEGARKAGAVVTRIDLRDLPMPLYDADFETAHGLPDNVLEFKKLMVDNDGLLISSPEHNSTVSALLKNVIDWASRRAADEPPLAGFSGKVAAIVSASPGALGGLRGLMQLRALLENMRVMVLPDQKTISQAHQAFSPDESLNDKDAKETIESIGAKLADTLAKLHG